MPDWILILAAVCIAIGSVVGPWLAHHNRFDDVPSAAMIAGGFVVGVFGLVGLHSYFGFIFFVPGWIVVGLGIGLALRRYWNKALHR
jgi:hypothetical protein